MLSQVPKSGPGAPTFLTLQTWGTRPWVLGSNPSCATILHSSTRVEHVPGKYLGRHLFSDRPVVGCHGPGFFSRAAKTVCKCQTVVLRFLTGRMLGSLQGRSILILGRKLQVVVRCGFKQGRFTVVMLGKLFLIGRSLGAVDKVRYLLWGHSIARSCGGRCNHCNAGCGRAGWSHCNAGGCSAGRGGTGRSNGDTCRSWSYCRYGRHWSGNCCRCRCGRCWSWSRCLRRQKGGDGNHDCQKGPHCLLSVHLHRYCLLSVHLHRFHR